MPSRIDEAGHTKAFDDPVAEHWGESQRAKRSLVGLEPTSATIERQLQLCLNKVHEWSVANGFKFSKSKTVCMHFCQLRTLHPDPSLMMDGDPIKVIKEGRFLGLVFDTKLSFLPHIRALKARCLKALDVLKVLAAGSFSQ